MDRKAKLRILSEKINKRHGRSTIGVGASLRSEPIKRLPTGSLSLDYALGGGLPAGRVITLYGERSSGKTTTAYRAMGVAQKLCINCLRPVHEYDVVETFDKESGEVEYRMAAECDCYKKGLFVPRQYVEEHDDVFSDRVKTYSKNSFEECIAALIDVEAAYDVSWAEYLGLDNRRLLYVCPDSAEEVIDIYESLIRTGSLGIMCLDSIAAMAPAKEIEESTENWQQGLAARLMNKFVRITTAAANGVAREFGQSPTQLWINQTREKIGVMFGDKTSLPGGKGQRFANSVEVKMWASDWKKDVRMDDLQKDFKMEMGNRVRINFKIEKNKTAPAKVQGGYDMFVAGKNAGMVDELDFIVALAEKYGEMKKISATKWKLGALEFKRKGDLMKALNVEPERTRVRSLVLKKMLGDVRK